MIPSAGEIVARLLIERGFATDPDLDPLDPWPVYFSGEPSIPDNCITVYDTSAPPDGRLMTDGQVFDHWGVQVRIRSTDYKTGYNQAYYLRNSCSESVLRDTVTIDGADYLVHCMSKFSSVLSLGKDVSNTKRNLFTFNAQIVFRPL